MPKKKGYTKKIILKPFISFTTKSEAERTAKDMKKRVKGYKATVRSNKNKNGYTVYTQ